MKKRGFEMKGLVFILFNIAVATFAYGQTPRSLSEQELSKIREEIDIQANKLRVKLSKNESYISDFQKKVSIDFAVDTFKIEQLLGKKIEADYSTSGIVNATYDALTGYDKLLNKYYKLLYSRLSVGDQPVLKEAQKSWIVTRDNEVKLIGVLANDQYSGGGTIQRILIASKVLDLTRSRVIQLVNYLSEIQDLE